MNSHIYYTISALIFTKAVFMCNTTGAHVDKDLLILLVHMKSPPGFGGIRFGLSVVVFLSFCHMMLPWHYSLSLTNEFKHPFGIFHLS